MIMPVQAYALCSWDLSLAAAWLDRLFCLLYSFGNILYHLRGLSCTDSY